MRKWYSLFLPILALIGGGFECMSVGMNILRPFDAMEDHHTLVLSAGLVTGLAGGIAAYVFLMNLLGRKIPPRPFRLSAAVLLAFFAFQMGIMATLVAFGHGSPWAYVIEGISGGPLFGWLESIVSAGWWPLPFIAVFMATVGTVLHRWINARAKGFLTSEGCLT